MGNKCVVLLALSFPLFLRHNDAAVENVLSRSTRKTNVNGYTIANGICLNSTVDINLCEAILDAFDVSYHTAGDIMLGGLFPVHLGLSCSILEDMGTIQRLEAMAYAVDKVNESPMHLKNLTLGYRIYDTCNSETAALSRTLELLPACEECTHYPICAPFCPVKVYGIVGPESSSNTFLAAHACNIALSPIVSYFATSVELNNVVKFPTLFKTVPSDDFQVTAMLDLMAYFRWNYFSIVHSDDRYGKDATEYMQSHMENMCLATLKQVSRGGTNASYDDVVRDLLEVKELSKTSTVVVFTDGISANRLFQAVERLNAVGQFMWIGSEGWGASLNDISSHVDVAKGALTFVPHTNYDEGFEEYFQSLGPDHDNPWWKEIWQHHFNGCSWEVPTTDASSCYQYDHIDASNGFVPDSTVSLVTRAVYAYADAIENYLDDTYPENDTIEVDELSMSPWKLLPYLGDILGFTKSYRDPTFSDAQAAVYDINNLQEIAPNTYEYVFVGSWNSSRGLQINVEMIQWPGDDQEIPTGYCSELCDIGEVQVFYKTSCCWDCEACTPGAVVANNTRCQVCPEFQWPNENKTECEDIPVTYLQWYDPPAIIFAVFAASNLILTKLSAMFFIRHCDDPLIKASGRELMAVIFCGIFLQNLLVFVLIAQPSKATCVLSRFVFGLDFTITYAPLLVKSNRIYRIFRAGKRSPVPPKWIKPKEQVLITLLLISVQVIITTVLVVVVPTDTVLYCPSPDVVELTCSLEQITVLIPLAYNFILVIACLAYSWKTRQLPTNFRESRFITFSVFTTLIIWSAFIPIYLTTTGSSSVQRVEILASVEIFSSFITLSSLFLPKFYALAFVPRAAWHLDKEFLSTTKRFRLDSERTKFNRISSHPATVKTISTSLSTKQRLVSDYVEKTKDEELTHNERVSPDGSSEDEQATSPVIQRRSASVDISTMAYSVLGNRHRKFGTTPCTHCQGASAFTTKVGILPSGSYPVLPLQQMSKKRRASNPFGNRNSNRIYFVDLSERSSQKESNDNPNFVPSRHPSFVEDSEEEILL